MSAARSRRAAGHAVRRRSETTPAPERPPTAPPTWRDPWAWASVLAVVPLVLHSMGAPLGEPCADDFSHLHHTLFSPRQTWLDNGGSLTYWRPLAYQGYYGLLTNVILARPLVIAALHVALLALASLLLYRTVRRSMPAPWAASAASFPLIAESTRALILVPIHFVDVGLILFSALALHEAAAGRLRSALLGLLAALLCKESAVATGLLLPWIAPSGGRAASGRRRWMVGTAAVILAWAVVYVAVQAQTGLLPRAMESNLQEQGTHWLVRYGWAAAGSVRAIFSLPAAHGRWDGVFVGGAVLSIAVGAAVCFVRSAAARARFSRIAPLVAVGALWTAVATVPLATVYPVWSPQRVAFNSVGFGVALSGTLGAAHPALLGALAALRLTLFGLSPGPPAKVSKVPPETGAFVDFEQLIRLQRLMAATRSLLHAHFPRLPHGAGVVQHHLPLVTYYAFGGDRALQVWYRDSTLRWVAFDEFRRDPGRQVATVVEWQPTGAAEVALVAPDAMRALLRATDHIGRGAWDLALAELDRADSLQTYPGADVFLGTVASKRSLGLVTIGRYQDAERAALEGLRAWPENPDSRYALAQLRVASGRLGEAELQLDSLLALYPDDRGAVVLREQVRAERARAPR